MVRRPRSPCIVIDIARGGTPMNSEHRTRRAFLRDLGRGVIVALTAPAGFVLAPRPAFAAGGGTHPDPRPGVDGSAVVPSDRVLAHLAELFDQVRAIPGVVDGIGCRCGCAALPEMYSLLSCYEGTGMAQYCAICEGSGRLVVQLHGTGASLEEIRAAVDRRYP